MELNLDCTGTSAPPKNIVLEKLLCGIPVFSAGKIISITFVIIDFVCLIFPLTWLSNDLIYSKDKIRHEIKYFSHLTSFLHYVASLYLCISCWRKCSSGILVWLFVSVFVFLTNIWIELYAFQKNLVEVENTLFLLICVLLIYGWPVIYANYKQISKYGNNFGATQNSCQIQIEQPDFDKFYYRISSPTSTFGPLRNVAFVCAFILTVISVISTAIIAVVSFYFDLSSRIFLNILFISYSLATMHMLIGITKKHAVFILIWLCYTAIFIVTLWILTVYILIKIVDIKVTVAVLIAECFHIYFWFIIYSYYVRHCGEFATSAVQAQPPLLT